MTNSRKKVTLPSLGCVSVNFYCIAKDVAALYEKLNEFDRQKSINHLGLISSEIDGASHSRYEYLMLQCAISDILDKLHKGSAPQGSLKVNGCEFSGNAILKAWFMLSNLGHLKNTYGDEKSLLLYTLKRSGFKSKLLNTIRNDWLKEWCKDAIENFQYQNFHYVISSYRIYKHQPRMLANQDKMALLLELLLRNVDEIDHKLNKEKLIQLKGLFKKIRDIAIVTIDGYYSHTPLSIDLLSSLVSFDEIEGGVFGKDISSSLSPLRNLLHEEIYLHTSVIANQRSYEQKAQVSLSARPQKNSSYETIIEDSLKTGLVTNHTKTLTPFCRIPIPKEIHPQTPFYNEFRNLTLKVRKNCSNVDAYLDHNPYTGMRYADFLTHDDFSPSSMPRFLSNIASLIRDQAKHLMDNSYSDYSEVLESIKDEAIKSGISEDTITSIMVASDDPIMQKVWNTASEHLFPSYRHVLWSVIGYFLKPNYRLDISNSEASYPNYSFSFPEFGDGLLKYNLGNAIKSESHDPDRVHELNMLKQLANRKFSGFKIAGLVRINILNMSNSPEKMKTTDIDAVLLKITENEITLELCEAKNIKSAREKTASKELRSLLVPALNKKARYQVKKVSGYGAKLVISCKT